MKTKFDELKEKIEALEAAKQRARSPEELMSIMFEINRLKTQRI